MAEKKPALAAEIAALYALPLGDWTAARNALASRLQKEGRKADAAEVKALAKPSLSAWAVDQLFHREGERMESLLAAGRRARSAQRGAMAGRGAEAFREALAEARRLADELRRRAVALLAEGGKAPGAAIVERIATDLEALAFSPAAEEAGARGWLDADLDPPGFEVLAGLQLAAAPSPSPPRLLPFRPREEAREEAEAARRSAAAAAKRRERVERAEAVVARAAEKAKAAAGEAAAARRQAEEAERAAAAAERRAVAAEAELARAKESLAAVRAALRDEGD